ncbi:MAG: hypothetical protein RLZZ214_773 [Verrucomicrobiota bacterium]|jgi:hypothetical protein
MISFYKSRTSPLDFLSSPTSRVRRRSQRSVPRCRGFPENRPRRRRSARWDRFSWFGLLPISSTATLGAVPTTFQAAKLIPALEAIPIQALEPRQKKKPEKIEVGGNSIFAGFSEPCRGSTRGGVVLSLSAPRGGRLARGDGKTNIRFPAGLILRDDVNPPPRTKNPEQSTLGLPNFDPRLGICPRRETVSANQKQPSDYEGPQQIPQHRHFRPR